MPSSHGRQGWGGAGAPGGASLVPLCSGWWLWLLGEEEALVLPPVQVQKDRAFWGPRSVFVTSHQSPAVGATRPRSACCELMNSRPTSHSQSRLSCKEPMWLLCPWWEVAHGVVSMAPSPGGGAQALLWRRSLLQEQAHARVGGAEVTSCSCCFLNIHSAPPSFTSLVHHFALSWFPYLQNAPYKVLRDSMG